MPTKPRRVRARTPNVRCRPAIGAGLVAAAASTGLLAAAAPAEAAAPPPITSLLEQGSSGAAVARVQRALHIGHSGRFSAATRRAVVAYQRHDGLLVDGIVGPQTWDALFHITPPPAPAAATSASSAGSGGYSIPSSIVQCESGGDYSAVNSSSGAGGAYQILPSTWQAYGGQGLPQAAPAAEQDRIAAAIYARQGASAWSC